MEEKTYRLGHHLVAFLDVLGQREKFRELTIPKTPDDQARVGRVLSETAGFVVQLRELFRKQFESFNAGIGSGGRIKNSVQPKLVGFSDSFVVSVSLWDDRDSLIPFLTIFSALWAASILMLTSLASKHALRGGFDVGLATEIAPGEIYGTALERAYVLEHDRAEYPRILVGDELWKFLSLALVEFENERSGSAKATSAIIRKMMQLISTDRDGQRILDYLGPVSAELISRLEANTLVRPSYEFVVAEQQRFLSEANTKLGTRYGLLRSYFESRLSQWGLTPHPL